MLALSAGRPRRLRRPRRPRPHASHAAEITRLPIGEAVREPAMTQEDRGPASSSMKVSRLRRGTQVDRQVGSRLQDGVERYDHLEASGPGLPPRGPARSPSIHSPAGWLARALSSGVRQHLRETATQGHPRPARPRPRMPRGGGCRGRPRKVVVQARGGKPSRRSRAIHRAARSASGRLAHGAPSGAQERGHVDALARA